MTFQHHAVLLHSSIAVTAASAGRLVFQQSLCTCSDLLRLLQRCRNTSACMYDDISPFIILHACGDREDEYELFNLHWLTPRTWKALNKKANQVAGKAEL